MRALRARHGNRRTVQARHGPRGPVRAEGVTILYKVGVAVTDSSEGKKAKRQHAACSAVGARAAQFADDLEAAACIGDCPMADAADGTGVGVAGERREAISKQRVEYRLIVEPRLWARMRQSVEPLCHERHSSGSTAAIGERGSGVRRHAARLDSCAVPVGPMGSACQRGAFRCKCKSRPRRVYRLVKVARCWGSHGDSHPPRRKSSPVLKLPCAAHSPLLSACGLTSTTRETPLSWAVTTTLPDDLTTATGGANG